MNDYVFEGVATALITPYSEETKVVDYKAFEKLVAFQTENSADAVVVCGTTGESPVLTSHEKSELFNVAVQTTSHKIPVIAGTGSNNTAEAVKKSNDAEKKGVDSLLIVTPFYNKCSQESLIDHYFYIADRVSTPIIVYNVPSRTGMKIKPETYLELSKHKNIIAVKEASADVSDFIDAITLCDNHLDFYSGNDDLIIPMMSYGAKGVISVVSNIIPEIIHKITHLCKNGCFNEAAAMHKKYLKLIRYMFCEVNPVPIKYAVGKIFDTSSELRLPLSKLTSVKAASLDDVLIEYELM